MVTYEVNTLGYRKLPAFAAVIQHGKSEIVTLNKENQYRCCPSYQRYKRQNKYRYQVHRLPERITDSYGNPSDYIFSKLLQVKRIICTINYSFCFFADVSKNG